jgi:large subunit ribosomal protein L3
VKVALPAEAPKPGAFKKAGAPAASEEPQAAAVEEAPAAAPEAGSEDAQ